MTLRLRLWSTIFTFGLLTILAVGTAVYVYEYHRLLALGQERLRLEANTHARILDDLLDSRARTVATIALDPALRRAAALSDARLGALADSERQARIHALDRQWRNAAADSPLVRRYLDNAASRTLRRYRDAFPGTYGELFLTDRFGALIAATGKLTTFAHGHKYWWRGAYADGKGQTYFDDRGFDDSVAGYVLGVVVPLRFGDTVNGILKANFNILQLLKGSLRQIRPHTRLVVARAGGRIVYRPGTVPLSQTLSAAVVKAIAANPHGGIVRYHNDNGSRLVAFAPIPLSLPAHDGNGFGGSPRSVDHRLGNTNQSWYVVASRDLEQITQTGTRELLGLAAFGLLVTMVIGASAWPLVARMEQRLGRTETQLTKAFETAVHGMALIGIDGRFLRVNDALCAITGYSRAELLHLDYQSITPEEEAPRDAVLLEQLLSGAIPDVRIEKRYLHKSGQEIWIHLSASLVRDQNGHPLHFVTQIEDVTQERAVREELARLARTDPLTGLFNRRHLVRELEEEIRRAHRFGHTVALVIFDVDHFKQTNDSYGHATGDRVLKRIAKVCQETLREVDILGRIGGEEFAAVLPESDYDNARHTAERLRGAVERMAVATDDGTPLQVTVSAGVATLPPETDFDTLYKAADSAMYRAKTGGRNRVC